jgi:hypothetical protein
LTNERKKMSTKTLRKRIALVAVATLGAGLISVAPANAVASGSAGDDNMVATSNILSIATKASTTGSAVVGSTAAYDAYRSVGLLYKDTSTGTAQTATMLASGALVVYFLASTATVVASGGKFSSLDSTTDTANTVSPDQKSFNVTEATAATSAAVWTPGAAGTYTIALYSGAGSTIASPTTGSLVGLVQVTVAAASVSGVYSAADSACIVQTSYAAVTTSSTEAAGANYRANTETANITFDLRDAYGVKLAAGATVATATNGAYVNIVSSGASKGTGSTAVSAAIPEDLSVVVSQPTANAPLSTTVTITYNGTPVCTKSVIITGEVASMKVSSLKAGATSSNADAFKLRTYDKAGNLVLPTAARFGDVDATLSTIVTAASISTAATMLTGDTVDSYSTGTFTCSGTAGTTSVKLAYQNPSGSLAVSDGIPARCAGNAWSYTASFDKASYVQGEIATLTVQFKDNLGNNANSYGSTGDTGTVTAPMLTMVGSLADAAKPDANGQIKIKFTVGISTGLTGGSYNALIDYSTLTGAETATIQTVAYKVSTGETGVSNADVLKSIVSLIASINKQIQALQKLILKRR